MTEFMLDADRYRLLFAPYRPPRCRADRYRLLFAPYRPPRCRVGRTWLRCAIRGQVKVAGISDAPILWPQCKAGKHLVPIICGSLVKAIRRESNQGVAHHWGVSRQTVTMWQKALGVPVYTDGTLRLARDWMPERLDDDDRERQRQATLSPERAAKISEALQGHELAPHVKRALLKANKNRKASKETRARMRAVHERLWSDRHAAGEGWQAAWDELLGTASDAEVAERLGCHADTVWQRRKDLRIPSWRPHKPMTPARKWTPADDKLLGTMPDTDLAARLRCTVVMVSNRRRKLGVGAFAGSR
jgi:hypothetical protein